MKKPLLALAISLGVALGSFGTASAPAMAAMSAPHMEMGAPSDAQLVKHSHKRWVCEVHWKKKRIWRWHHWVWIKVPVRTCHWVWPHHNRHW
ncbi:MAG: hypothetical protein ABI399_06015 [Bauldia sp.]